METERNYYTDLVLGAEQSRDCLDDLDPGTKERAIEAEIYDKLVKNLIEEEKLANQADKEAKELELKKQEAEWRHEKELQEFKLENERILRELEIRKDEAKWNKILGVIKISLTTAQIGVSGFFGWNYLKFNAKFGNMLGKDGKSWFDEIRRVKF